MAGHALPVANERRIEHRMAGGICPARLRCGGTDKPARSRGIFRGLSAEPQEKGRHIRLLGRKQQFARGRKIETLRIAPGRDNHRTCSANAKAIRSRLKHILRRGTAHDDEALRVEADVPEAGRIGKPMFLGCEILFKPQDEALVGGSAQGKSDDEACCCPSVTCLIGKDLMDCAPLDSVAEHAVERFDAEGKGRALGGRRNACAQRRNITPQRRKIDGCRHLLNP